MDDASLSRMYKFGLFPLLVNVERIGVVVSRISASLRVLVGIACMIIVF